MRIAGWGTRLPEHAVDNDDLERRFGLPRGWIHERSGIRSRRIAAPDESTATLAGEALTAACSRADLSLADLDLLVVATTTPEQPVPSTASIVAGRVGARGAALDVSAACTGFASALVLAHGMMAFDPRLRTVGVVGADVFSRIVDPADRNTSVLFGDGAGAVVLERGPADARFEWNTTFDAATDILEVPVGGSRVPVSAATVDDPGRFLQMHGREVMRRAVPLVVGSTGALLARASCRADQIDLFVPHQANRRIMLAVAQRLGVPAERVFSNVEHVGNTSAASLAIALAQAIDDGRLRDGMTVLLAGFGAGMCATNVLFECRIGEAARGGTASARTEVAAANG